MSLAQATWRALGMTVVVALADRGGLDRARRIVEEELAAADAAYSPVRRDTELVRVEAAGGAPVPVGDCLLGAIEVALRAARATDGLVDPAVGAALTLAEAEPRADADADLERGPRRLRARRTPGWQAVAADRATATASVPRGVRLDLGATGKALIADRAAARIATGGPGALVGLGGDLATAGASPPGGWLVRVTDDSRAIEGGELRAPGLGRAGDVEHDGAPPRGRSRAHRGPARPRRRGGPMAHRLGGGRDVRRRQRRQHRGHPPRRGRAHVAAGGGAPRPSGGP